MPLCGFNKEMLEGLKEFHKGLVIQKVSKKSEENKLKLGKKQNGSLWI